MKISPVKAGVTLAICAGLALAGCTNSPSDAKQSNESSDSKSYSTKEVTDGTTTFNVVTNPGDGATLSYGTESDISLIEVEDSGQTYVFKDMDGSKELEPWEDWRLSAQERAKDLAPKLSTEQIAGLMLFSPSEYAVGDGLSDAQKKYLSDDKLRLVLSAGTNNVEDNVTWSNEMQAYVETLATPDTPYIPVNFSTDPRSDASGGYAGNATPDISMWPGNLGLAATFDADIVRQFGQMASEEYRALGITNVLSPQVDVASDPRWMRINGTFGEDADLSAELTSAFVEGFQDTLAEDGTNLGWGGNSVSATIKHFAGDAAGEGGRASYGNSGKYAVFPGDNFEEHLKPFENGLDAAGVMTTYSILVDGNGDPLFGKDRVAGAFNKDLVDILRADHNYEGVIMTDWGVTAGGPADPDADWAVNWGVEDLTVEERHYLVLLAGIDMFGGNTEVAPVLAAHDMWQEAFDKGELDIDADTRFEQSAQRILQVIFASGLYDNPFLDLEHSQSVAGSDDKMDAGFEAQKKSVVVLKNADETIACSPETETDWSTKTVYIPRTFDISSGYLGDGTETTVIEDMSISQAAAEEYFGKVVTDEVKLKDDGSVESYTAPDLADVDVVLVGMASPNNGQNFSVINSGFDPNTEEYRPISLQYRPYTADSDAVRKTSISGDILPDGKKENRSYFGKTTTVSNEANLDSFERAVKAVKDSGKDIPIISVLKAGNPIVPTEFEKDSDAIVVGFDISDEALIEVALGLHDGTGRLPIAFPASMAAIEDSLEDVSGDIDPYKDSEGNTYDFGFGLSCNGPIK